MPELPEVETIRLGLLSTVIGQRISRVDVLLGKMFTGDPERVLGASVRDVSRRGKLLILDIEGDSFLSLLIHLKMTGQLLFKSLTRPEFAGGHPVPPLNTPLPNKSTKVIFTFESGDILYFNDLRTFGYIKLVERENVFKERFLQTIGVEPLSDAFTLEYFKGLLKKYPKMSLKSFLLDQRKIAGLGNIYTDEALFLAYLHPTRLTGSLSASDVKSLYDATRSVLQKGIQLHGASKTSYVTLDGTQGTFLADVAVYQQQGKPCPRCGTLISKFSFAGRGTHVCVQCQK